MNKIGDAFERLKKFTMSMDLDSNYGTKWDWPQGVALYGLLRGYQNTKDSECLRYIENWVEERLSLAHEKIAVNAVAPMIVVSELYRMKGDATLLKICERYIDWIFNEAPRLECGALEHTVLDESYKFPGQAWVDTTFMCCLFLTTMWELTGNEKYRDEALFQLKIHHRILKDKKTGLVCHGYDENLNLCPGNGLWGRGNGWIAVTSAEVLARTGLCSDDALYVNLMLKEQLESVVNFRDTETKRYRTLIDKEDSYFENSGTACLAYAMLIGADSLKFDAKFKQAGMETAEAIINMVDNAGALAEVSGGTGLTDDLEHYKDRPTHEPMPWGQGIGLALLSYMLKREN